LKEYDLILIGTGSGMSIVEVILQGNPNVRIAVIDKDDPGGICLTKVVSRPKCFSTLLT